MENEFNLTPEESEIEQSLGALALNAAAIDEHAIWFEAGVRRGRRSGHRWQVATAASLILAVGSFGWNLGAGSPVAQQHPVPSTSVARGPRIPADTQAFHAIPVGRDSLQDLIESTGWHMLASDEPHAGSSRASNIDDLSAARMLERATNPKDFLTMRS